ncbi:hypothetical protein [Massilia niabensis]|uniref:DUF2306 domain-containing protein n=1 Tax=Massilia niabensis TaxID=544910 RepID=A0ABW0KZS3_9BURK
MSMSPTHLINLVAHFGAGVAAMILGFLLLASAKGTPFHRKRGRVFAALALVVCATGVVGNVFFRFIPLFAVLTVLVAYQLLSGWHVIYTKAAGPNRIDALLAVCAASWALYLIPLLLSASGNGNAAPAVIFSSFGALVFLLVYDCARWCFPRRWHALLWRCEHIYKLIASLFAMLSAAMGNLVSFGQPWSQLTPSVLGMATIVWFIWRDLQARRRSSSHNRNWTVAGE